MIHAALAIRLALSFVLIGQRAFQLFTSLIPLNAICPVVAELLPRLLDARQGLAVKIDKAFAQVLGFDSFQAARQAVDAACGIDQGIFDLVTTGDDVPLSFDFLLEFSAGLGPLPNLGELAFHGLVIDARALLALFILERVWPRIIIFADGLGAGEFKFPFEFHSRAPHGCSGHRQYRSRASCLDQCGSR